MFNIVRIYRKQKWIGFNFLLHYVYCVRDYSKKHLILAAHCLRPARITSAESATAPSTSIASGSNSA